MPLLTTTLENVPNWKDQWTEYKKQEIKYDGMPMITEGNNLYVFGRQKKKKPDQSEQVVIIINIYEINREKELPSFKFLRTITLMKNGFQPFVKD